MEVDGWLRCFLLTLASLLLSPQQQAQTQTINHGDDGIIDIDNGSLTSATPLSSTMPMTIADDADSETNNCDGVVLVDYHSYRTRIKNRVKDFMRCSENNTVSRCMITFTGGSKFLMETHQLCYAVDMIDLFHFESKSRLKITLASGAHRREYKNGARGLYLDDEGFCASQSEDLLMTYETDDNFCSPGFKHGFVGQVGVMQRPYFENTMNLMSEVSCDLNAMAILTSSTLTGTIVSSYEPEWSEGRPFCTGTIYTSHDTVRVCFRSTHFRTYPDGAYLTIASGTTRLIFDHSNPLTVGKKKCIAVEDREVSIRVMQGKGTRKFDHAFLIFYNTVQDDSSNDVHNDNDDDNDWTSSSWFIFIITVVIVTCFFCCCVYGCCKGTKAPPSYEASVAMRNDEPTNHPAFSSSSRFTHPPTSAMSPQPPSGGNDSRTTEEISIAVLEHAPFADKAMPKRDMDGLPTYDSLFSSGKKL